MYYTEKYEHIQAFITKNQSLCVLELIVLVDYLVPIKWSKKLITSISGLPSTLISITSLDDLAENYIVLIHCSPIAMRSSSARVQIWQY